MEKLHFTSEQVREILNDFARRPDGGIDEVFKLCIETLMRGERELHNTEYKDVSNGYRKRKSYARGKQLELKVPRSRFNQFYPVILGLLRDEEEECRKLAFGLYGAGLTTEQVGELFEQIYGRSYSSSQVSRMFEYARQEVSEWIKRPLDEYYPIVYIDATFIPVRRGENISKEAFYTILGVKSDRSREVLTIVNLPTESAQGWSEVLKGLKERGVKEIGLVVCDGLTGIEDAIYEHYKVEGLQLCTVHLERNVIKYARAKDKKIIAQEYREVFQIGAKGYTKEEALERWREFTEKWGKIYPAIGRMGKRERIDWYFTYLSYDYRIQSMIHSTNWIERLNRDYKRTTRMRGALPNAESAILLLGYVAMTRKAYERKLPKLDYERTKFRWEA